MRKGWNWADKQGIPKGVLGETHNGIAITETNRLTNWAKRKRSIQELYVYTAKCASQGINAVLFGVARRGVYRYAVFVNSRKDEDASKTRRGHRR